MTFGHFLIKQVVEEVSRELPRISNFVTLSPAPNFAAWLNRERTSEASLALDEDDRETLTVLAKPDWWRDPASAAAVREPLIRAAAWYYLRGRDPRGLPLDFVAAFISATARGSNGSIGSATPLSGHWRNRTA